MNRYAKIDPEQVAEARRRSDAGQLGEVYEAFNLIKQDNAFPDDWWWASTAAAAYRAGRLSMWRDMARLKARDPKTPAASYRRALHHLTDQIKDADRLKRLYDLAQYLWREGGNEDGKTIRK